MWLHPFILRCKIQAIISRNTPVPDPDAPECAQSVRFWCTSGGQATERERTRVSAQARANVATTAEGLTSLLGTTNVGPMLGAGAEGGTVGNRPTLKALVDVANSQEASHQQLPKAKSKAKAKAKASVNLQVPKTPAEQRQQIRNFFLLNAFLASICTCLNLVPDLFPLSFVLFLHFTPGCFEATSSRVNCRSALWERISHKGMHCESSSIPRRRNWKIFWKSFLTTWCALSL